MKVYDVMIIGAGPSGMTAALQCGRGGLSVLLLEQNELVGRKILSTGNGRCNLTNVLQEPDRYRSDTPDRAWEIVYSCSCRTMEDFFKSIGIYTREREGYVYPYNEQARTVREAFREALCAESSVRILTKTRVKSVGIRPGSSGDDGSRCLFAADSERERFYARYLIVATGGKAAPSLGTRGDGYDFARSLGHRILPPLPALMPLKSGAPFLKKLAGTRSKAAAALFIDGNFVMREQGELQWTDYGISGVAVFQLSRYAAAALQEGRQVSLHIDFIPEHSAAQLTKIWEEYQRNCAYRSARTALQGFLPDKLCPVLLREAKITPESSLSQWKYKDIEHLSAVLKDFELRIRGYADYDKAQTTQGGVPLSELDHHLQSLRRPGLYFTGEVTDVDGACGGYNLQWAFVSGMKAAEDILKKEKETPYASDHRT